jgi:hypothetical protein
MAGPCLGARFSIPRLLPATVARCHAITLAQRRLQALSHAAWSSNLTMATVPAHVRRIPALAQESAVFVTEGESHKFVFTLVNAQTGTVVAIHVVTPVHPAPRSMSII